MKNLIDNQTLQDLLLHCVEVNYLKGDIIARAIGLPQEMFFVVSGKVGQYDISSSGNKIIMNTYGRDSFFSLSWLYGSSNEHYYEALEDCRIKIVSLQNAKEFFEKDRAIYDYYIGRIMRGLNGLYKRLSIHMTEDAQQRIVYELLLESDRFYKEITGVQKVLAIPISALSNSTGLTRETVSREISSLIKDGYIEKQGRAIVIKDIERLRGLSS